MQYQSEVTSTNQMWNEKEIKELILYTKQLQSDNEDLRAKIIAMDAYVKNADSKIKILAMQLTLQTKL